MKKDVAQYLEFSFEKLDCLKKSDRGEVWRARRRNDGELVIIKRVNEIGLPYDALKKFQFTLPAKIFLCAVDEDESDTIIVEEFICGENLFERLEKQNFFSEDEARAILLQMCDGLGELHAKNIIHRDIKPSNLILQGERIRLIDFDAARIFKPDKNADTHLFGTKGYAPPEQHGFGGRQTDERSDIYSLGVTMKVLLGGNLGRLKEILDKCTELDPKNRFQNVYELKIALNADKMSDKSPDNVRYKKNFTPGFFIMLGILISFTAMKLFMLPEDIEVNFDVTPRVEEKNLQHNDEFNLSLGKLKLGDSVEVMHEIFGREDRLTPSETPNKHHCEYKNIVVTFSGDSIIGLVSYSSEIQTERGIHEGSTLDEVISAYGRRAAVYKANEVTLYEYLYESAQGNLAVMRFAVKNNVVEYISLRLANDERYILTDVHTI
ncbi:MAG: serine/threonine protein kinase [Selenomonadaceae bacterium]|nr:serine/threonine protein kinase [Selenomonadaceae bacterium]MBR4382058.1 serine/threonine protein kinase [Selenomonadaceae bacterium]